jgi:hypothetical protein
MTIDTDLDPLQRDAMRLSRWARGDEAMTETVVVTEDPTSIPWLAGMIGELDTVVCALPRKAKCDLPKGPGTWIQATGAVTNPGDDIGLGRELYIQTMDYCSLRYLNVLGPTMIRIMTAEDAEALLVDVDTALRTGHFPEQLLHPLVELADRCALRGSTKCSGRSLERMHIDRAGVVRTSPTGRVVGHVGDDLEALATRAAAPGQDPCLNDESSSVLRTHGFERIRTFAAGLDAARILAQRSRREWWLIAEGGDADRPAPRSDLLLLTDGTSHVLYESASRRAFRLDVAAAQLAGAILISQDAQEVVTRLCASGQAAISADHVRGFRAELQSRGVELTHAHS